MTLIVLMATLLRVMLRLFPFMDFLLEFLMVFLPSFFISRSVYDLNLTPISSTVLTGMSLRISYKVEYLGPIVLTKARMVSPVVNLVNAYQLFVEACIEVSETLVVPLLDVVKDTDTLKEFSFAHVLHNEIVLQVSQ